MAEDTANPLQQLSNLSEMHIVRQLVLFAGLAGSIALGVAVVLWSQQPEHSLLYAGLNPEESASITTALDQRGLSYSIDPRSGAITVPQGEVHSTRMALAQLGLLNTSSPQGFDILNQDQSLSTTTFTERARFNRALQEELQKTIASINGINAARVHLSQPKQTTFLRSSVSPSASVWVKLVPGMSLNEMQIAGIRHLVAASVVGLAHEDVSVLDQDGTLLSMEDGNSYAISANHLRLQRTVEQDYAQRIVDLLTPIVGQGRVHAQVSVNMDLTEEETTVEDYDPASALRSEQTQSEETTQDFEAGGVPGLLEDDLNAAGDALEEEPDVLKSKTSQTRNFELDRIISHRRRGPGAISSISVAVLIDSPEAAAPAEAESAEEVELDPEAGIAAAAAERNARLEELVKNAIGFDEARGDRVSLVDSDFFQQPIEFEVQEPGLMEDPLLWKGLRMGGAGFVVLLLIFGVLRPVLKSSVAAGGSLPRRGPEALAYPGGMPEGMAEGFQGEDQVTLSGGNPGNRLAGPNAARQYETNLAQVRTIVENEPDRAARVVQGWVADD